MVLNFTKTNNRNALYSALLQTLASTLSSLFNNDAQASIQQIWTFMRVMSLAATPQQKRSLYNILLYHIQFY